MLHIIFLSVVVEFGTETLVFTLCPPCLLLCHRHQPSVVAPSPSAELSLSLAVFNQSSNSWD